MQFDIIFNNLFLRISFFTALLKLLLHRYIGAFYSDSLTVYKARDKPQ